MNIRRFVAPNSRAALREVREVLGGDAVIISNRPTGEGVEVLAAAAGELARLTSQAPSARDVAPRPAQATAEGPRAAPRSASAPAPAPVTAATPARPAAGSAPEWVSEAQVVRTRRRIATLLENSGEIDSRELDAEVLLGSGAAPVAHGAPAAAHAAAAAYAATGVSRRPVPAPAPRPAPVPVAPPVAVPTPARAAAPVATPSATPAAVPVAKPAPQPQPAKTAAPQQPRPPAAASAAARGVAQASGNPVAAERPSARADGLADEIRAMKGFIEEQLANFAWGDGVRRQPGRMKLMEDLITAGFSPALSRHLQENLPDDFSHAQGREWARDVLQRNILCGSVSDDLTDQGGVFALVGPTGVGKTTTAAKMAARFAVKHGMDQLALITTDAYRIGAQDQLRIYGKILGIPVHTIHDQASLASTLQSLAKKKLVLIDTAGLGQRDERLTEQIAMLRGGTVKRLLVLNSTVQAETLEEVVAAYASRDVSGCVLTKIDETVRLGAVLDVAIRHRLKIHYVCNGQRVPEDLHHPNLGYLVHRALRPAARSKVFGITEGDHPAWLAAIAQSARLVSTKGQSHV